MDTNFQVVAKTFQAQHCPLQQLKRNCLFTELFESKDGKVVKKRTFQTKGEFLTWKKQIIEEMLIQRQLAQQFPDKFLQIIDYSVETYNHRRFLYVTYDCDKSASPLFKYLEENQVDYQEQIDIVEQILQILCLLQKQNCHHAKLKPDNLIYYKKRVLLTDFGSARTHYLNFTKQYSGQKEKKQQNKFLFFQIREYLEIIQEENIDFHDDMWIKVNTEDEKILTRADKWAIGVMILQVFENSQILPNKIDQFYGLNEENLMKKLSILEKNKNVITKMVVEDLLIKDLDAFTVYQSFQKHKKYIDVNKVPQQFDEILIIQEIFDQKAPKFEIDRIRNPDYYYMEKKKIQAIQTLYDKDDVSSVASAWRPIIETINDNVQSTDNLQKVLNQPDKLFVSQQIPKVPPKQDVFAKQNPEQILYQDDDLGFKRPGQQKPSIRLFQESKDIGQNHLTEQDDDENIGLINRNPTRQSSNIVGYEPQQQSNRSVMNDQQNQGIRLDKQIQSQQIKYFFSKNNGLEKVQGSQASTPDKISRFYAANQSFDFQNQKKLQEVVHNRSPQNSPNHPPPPEQQELDWQFRFNLIPKDFDSPPNNDKSPSPPEPPTIITKNGSPIVKNLDSINDPNKPDRINKFRPNQSELSLQSNENLIPFHGKEFSEEKPSIPGTNEIFSVKQSEKTTLITDKPVHDPQLPPQPPTQIQFETPGQTNPPLTIIVPGNGKTDPSIPRIPGSPVPNNKQKQKKLTPIIPTIPTIPKKPLTPEINITIKPFDPPKSPPPPEWFEEKIKEIKHACANDGILLSLNKYIRSFQLNDQLYQLKELVPQNCIEQMQEKQETIKTDNFNKHRYQGFWLDGSPHGFGTLREEKNSAIYRGIFKMGKFYWGQVLEINESGLLTLYIGSYHNLHNVKNGKSKMTWFKPQMSRLNNYTFVQHESYEGQFVLGRIQGKGKKIYSNESYYEGEWKNNLRNGRGKFVQKINNRQIIYIGSFQNDYQQGECKAIHDENKNLYEIGQYEKGKPIGIHDLFLGDKKQKSIQN